MESSSDEEDLPPTKKHCPVTSAAIPALPGGKGYEERRGDWRTELLSAHRQALGQGREDGPGPDRGYLYLASFSSSFPSLRVLTSGHQPSSVLRSPAMGTLGSDFLSSLPLHEYPPAFPLGADIQGITHILRGWVGSRGVPPCYTLSRPVSLRSLGRGMFFLW